MNLPTPIAEPRTYPLAGIRRLIAQKMTQSLHEAAQLSFHADADITDLQAWRGTISRQGRKISLEDAIIAAYVAALSKFPIFNAAIDGNLVTEHAEVNLAVAIAAPTGLVTPVIAGADSLDLDALSAVRADLVARALKGLIKVSEMKGATATLSNLGRSRVRHFTPILNHPQCAILGVGAVREAVRISAQGQLEVRKSLGLSLTVDHRLIDGAPAAEFLGSVCEQLEHFDR